MARRSFNLSLKLTICLIGSMAIIFGLLGYRNIRLHKRHLEDIIIVSADRISDTIKRGTRYSMLKNHRDEVYQSITTIGGEPGINKIRIFNEQGKISFSTDEHEINQFVDQKTEACYVCHSQDQPLTRLDRPDRVRIYTGSEGGRILGVINPIENEPSCYNASCHAHPPSQQVLGVLDVTMSLTRVDETIGQGERLMIANIIGAITIISLLVGSLIWRMVYKPVTQLIAGTHRVAEGDLEYKINVSSRDEIGKLATSFNRMTGELKQANDQLTEWAKTLESRVDQKTVELKRTHEQMVQIERMASIGKLAAIVAHEINNPLAGILTYAKLLLKKMRNNGLTTGDDANAVQYLEMISTESARCGDIVKNLLQFARQTQIELQPNDVNQILQQAARLVQHKIELMSIQTRIQMDEDIPLIVCDAQQLRQALVALLINACEAVNPGEGVLELETHHCPLERRVEITIRDNGIGMDRETQKHIFEPFFTTKEQGKGVGLGLAVVYGIVSRHSGTVRVDSSPGQGTSFTLRLPEKPESAYGENGNRTNEG